ENIAKVFDAGTTDEGRPFFVMELVSGTPITKFCDAYKLGIPERLGLFNQVCNAVQHAHQKGIIHRDLKPGNVLVALQDDKPVAKVIDFGLAKATSQKLTQKTLFTEHGQILGTLRYMSPEQANWNDLDVDTRSDIYSLGVILYELLTGSTPLKRESLREAGFMEILDRIKEEDPERPSSRISESVESLASISSARQVEPRKFSAIMKGELDWIILKAMEKDRTRRYETANGFAADIRRYLSDEPILARPPSAGYKLSKLIRKNRFAVGFIGTVALLLVMGIGVSTYLTFWAMDETAIARAAQQQSDEDRIKANASEKQANQERTKAKVSEERATKDRILAQDAQHKEEKAKLAAIASQEKTEATLARSNFLLADARWNDQRVGDANHLLNQVPEKYRNFEWYLSRQQYLGSDFTCYGHISFVRSIAFSPDGTRLDSGSADGTIKLWDAQTGSEFKKLTGPATYINFSPDGKLIYAQEIYGKKIVWDIQTGKPLANAEWKYIQVNQRISPDKR
ncbi:MAG: hypothetical protein COA78_14120, partial [Blastopirellula sp.]